MVRTALRTLTAEIRGLHQAAYLIGAFAIASQVLALLRDKAFTHTFGAGPILDVYFAAFKIPDFIFVVIASLVSAYVLIPFLAEKQEVSKKVADVFLGQIVGFFLLAMGAVSLVAWVCADQLLSVLVPGLVDSPHAGELVTLTRILLLQPILLGLSGIYGAVTQLSHRFVLYSLSPLLYNAGIIFGVMVLYPTYGIPGLGYGVLAGALLHLLIQLPALTAGGHRFLLRMPGMDVVRVIRVAIPRALALSSGQLTLLALVSLASLFASGSVAILSLALNLQSVPLSIIAVSYSVAAFPTLAAFIARKENKEFLEHMSIAVRHIIFWSIPATMLFIVLRAQVVRVIFGSGAFTWEDTRLTAAALAIFVASVTAQGLNLLFIRAYYAAGRTRVPFLVSMGGAVFTILIASWLVFIFQSSAIFRGFFENLLRVVDTPGTEVLMLSLAYSLGTFVVLGIFIVTFSYTFGALADGLWRVLFHTFGSSVIGAYGAYWALQYSVAFFDTDTFSGIFAQGLSGGVTGIALIVAMLALLKSPELFEIIDSLSKRLRPQSVPPGQDL